MSIISEMTKNYKLIKKILRAGVEPATYGLLTTCYSPPLYQLSYRRVRINGFYWIHNITFQFQLAYVYVKLSTFSSYIMHTLCFFLVCAFIILSYSVFVVYQELTTIFIYLIFIR